MDINVADNLKRVWERINRAREKVSSSEVKLIAVTKKISESRIGEAIKAGHRLFGENYVQEALKKIEKFEGDDIEWHFIGALQSNKAKYCLDKFSMIQTVDRESLANTINKEALKRDIRNYPVLIEVNLAGEESKTGVSPERLEELIINLSKKDGIKIKGLMAIPPFFDDSEKSRSYFTKLRELKEKILELNIENIEMKELSMGMSGDYGIAVEEGATIVRVGTAIFGPRY